MKFKYSPENGSVILSAEELASFARQKNAAPLFSACSVTFPDDMAVNVPLTASFEVEDTSIALEAYADMASSDGGAHATVVLCREKRKRQSAAALAKRLEALAAVTGYLYAHQYGADDVRMILSFTDPEGEVTSLLWECSTERLSQMFSALLLRALPFARITARHGASLPLLAELPFPFPTIREGQHEFISAAFRAIKSGSRLLCSAPTGIGKTMSALYPAVRAIGRGQADKVFCLCAKNVTGKAASDAAERLAELAPELRSITISSKERSCVFREQGFFSARCRRGCAMLSKLGNASYESRRDAALLFLLDRGVCYTPEAIAAAADEFAVCPYELSLDLSEYCDIVICDYNYVFDFSIRFRRYFEDVRERYVFIIDEAHNLPKRGRDTYSASLGDRFLSECRALLASEFPGDAELESSLKAFSQALEEIRELLRRESELSDSGESFAFFKSSELPLSLANSAAALSRTLSVKLREHSAFSRELEHMDSSLRKFVSVCGLFDEHYTFFAQSVGNEVSACLLCLDPSVLLDRAMSAARSSVLFSATLSPLDYFADVCGCQGAETLDLDSPYDSDNLLLVALDSVKTTLSERDFTAEEVAELILTVVEGRCGNYIAFFPSYAYLNKVAKKFRRMADGVTLIIQTPGMRGADRRAFLSQFETAEEGETKLAFCVLGGMFSEGIDLSGERLIGAIIVSTGMGSITSEQNILREYYDETREDGMAYAYVYPGFNNVLQAAGRVIRSESDRGVVVLIDERYGEGSIQRLFPKHWSHIRFTSDPFSLSELLARFWNEK